MTAFDPNTFAAMTFQEANSTESFPVPVGEYPGTIDKKDIVTWAAKDGSSAGLKMNVIWSVENQPAVTEITGREKNLIRQEFMFDLTESGMLDTGKGKNVKLGRLRAAVGLNTPGEPFSFDMLVGRCAKISVGHRPDQRDSSVLYAEVKDVAAM